MSIPGSLTALTIESAAQDARAKYYADTQTKPNNFETSVNNDDGTTTIFRFEGSNIYSETVDKNGNKTNIFSYTIDGNTRKSCLDKENDGKNEFSVEEAFDKDGNIIFSQNHDDYDPKGINTKVQHKYNELGQEVETLFESWFDDGSELFDNILTLYNYDSIGRLVSELLDKNNDGSTDSITFYEYDEYSRLIREVYDNMSNDNANFIEKLSMPDYKKDKITTYEYSSKRDESKSYFANRTEEFCILDKSDKNYPQIKYDVDESELKVLNTHTFAKTVGAGRYIQDTVLDGQEDRSKLLKDSSQEKYDNGTLRTITLNNGDIYDFYENGELKSATIHQDYGQVFQVVSEITKDNSIVYYSDFESDGEFDQKTRFEKNEEGVYMMADDADL